MKLEANLQDDEKRPPALKTSQRFDQVEFTIT